MSDPNKTEKTPNVDELIAKVNTLITQNTELNAQLQSEKLARIRIEKLAKINSLNPDFKDDAKMSPDFLDGIAFAYANPIKPKENSGTSSKTNTAPATPTDGSPRKYNTPDGKDPGDKPLTIYAGNWNQSDNGGGF